MRKIWRVVRHDHHEIDPLGACLRRSSARNKDRSSRAWKQQGRQGHARIEWRLTKPAFVACDDLLYRSCKCFAAREAKRRRTAPDGPKARNQRSPEAGAASDQSSKRRKCRLMSRKRNQIRPENATTTRTLPGSHAAWPSMIRIAIFETAFQYKALRLARTSVASGSASGAPAC